MNNGIFVQDVYGKVGFEEKLPKSLSGFGNVVPLPYHLPPNNDWKNNTQQYLILVYDTTKQNNTTISIPYAVQGVTNFLIDWGDGITEAILWTDNGNSRSTFHTYSSHGVYAVIVSGRLGRLGRANVIPVPSLIKCYSFGDIGLLSVAAGFATCPNLEEAPPILATDIAATNSLFLACTIFNDEKIKYWDTTNITNMSSMFFQARRFDQDLGSWNMANVTNISAMFGGASSFNNGGSDSINNWNTSNITNMSNVFEQALVFNQPVGNWNTGNVTTMAIMFFNALVFNQDINNWDTSKVTSMQSMFSSARSFNQPLNNWNVRKVTNFLGMFQSATSFNSSLSGWGLGADTTGTSCQSMFQGASVFDQDLSSWNTSQVTNMSAMFNGASNFNQNIGNWNTSKVTLMNSMFLDARSFNQDLSNWDVSNVTNMFQMFGRNTPTYLFNNGGSPNINNWNVGNVTNISYMFANNPSFNQPIGNWNVSKVQTMSNMFQGSNNAFNQDISNWNLAGLNVNTGLDGFMFGKTGTTAYSTTNYDALLIGWNNNKLASANGVANWRTDLRPNFGGAKYTSGGAAATARAALVTYGWTITDGGVA